MKIRPLRSLLALLLSGLMALALSACGTLPQTPTQPDVTQQSTQPERTLQELSDDQLYETVYLETLDLVYSFPSEQTALKKMPAERRVFYIVSMYDMEVQNGGLCQFFTNSTRVLVPALEECLEAVGATDHQALFADFIQENEIDLNDLSSFAAHSTSDYIEQTQRFDYDTFDNSFSELPPLSDALVAYIRAHLEVFA